MELGGRRGQEGEHGGRRGKGCWIPGGLGQARKLMRRRQPAESKQIGKIRDERTSQRGPTIPDLDTTLYHDCPAADSRSAPTQTTFTSRSFMTPARRSWRLKTQKLQVQKERKAPIPFLTKAGGASIPQRGPCPTWDLRGRVDCV